MSRSRVRYSGALVSRSDSARSAARSLAWSSAAGGAASAVVSRLLDCEDVEGTVDPGELIASIDVAEILGLAQASSVATYLRRYTDFPRPVVELQRSHVRLWRRPEIEAWAHARRSKRVGS